MVKPLSDSSRTFRTRNRNILQSPEQYVNDVKSCLHTFDGLFHPEKPRNATLTHLQLFLREVPYEAYQDVLRQLVDYGLLSVLLDALFHTPWVYKDSNEVHESRQVILP